MKASDIMTPHPQVVTAEDCISRAAQIMRDSDVGSIPVVRDSSSMSLMGMITDRDITIRHVAEAHVEDCSVATHMSRDDIATVGENDDVEQVMDAMRRREVRRIPVTNKSGKLVGVIAQADIAVSDEIAQEDVADVVKSVSEPTR